MIPFLAQAVPPLWMVPVVLLFALGIPFSVFLSFNAVLLLRYLPKTPFVVLAYTSISLSLLALVPMEMTVTDGKDRMVYRGLALLSVSLGVFALYRRSRLDAHASHHPPGA